MVDPLNTKAIEAAKSAVIGNPFNDEQIHRIISAYLSALPAVDGGDVVDAVDREMIASGDRIGAKLARDLLAHYDEAEALILSQKGEIERLTKERDEALLCQQEIAAGTDKSATVARIIIAKNEADDRTNTAESRVLSLEKALRNLAEAVDCEVDIGGKSGLLRKRLTEARAALQEKKNG